MQKRDKTISLLRLLVFFLLIGMMNRMSAQDVDFTKANFPGKEEALKEALRNVKKGNDLFNGGEQLYNLALDYYLKANSFNPENAELNYKIGVCYLFSSFKTKSIQYLEKAKRLKPDVNKKLIYYFARAHHLRLEWSLAIQEYETYEKSISGSSESKSLDIEKRITECRNGMQLMEDTLRMRKLPDSLQYKIINLGSGVNSRDPDYRPVISADESVMYFTSRRENTTGGGIDQNEGKYYEDIYFTTYENGKWSEAKNSDDPINRSNQHDATCGLSIDGQKLYIYLDDTYNGSGNIYECTLNGKSWSKPKRLANTINSKYHESSASLSPDGKTLYFCSENPTGNTGIGSHDIYKSTLNAKGEWGQPENLSSVLNTVYDERTVFIHPDGNTLYFSSQGHNSMGGYDLFKSVYNDSSKKWSLPVNLGFPINSPDDEVDFVVAANGKHAYYSAIRADGFGEKDIYRIAMPADTTVYLTLIKGNTSDESNNPLGAVIEIVDTKTGKIISKQESNNATGKFLVSLPSGRNYKVKISADGYLSDEQVFNIPKGEKFKELDLYIELKRKEQLVEIVGTVTDEKGRTIASATIEVINNATEEVVTKTVSDKSGKYKVKLKAGKNYGIVASEEGYLFQSLNIDIPPDKDHIELNPISLKKMKAGSNMVLNNIFFDFDRSSLRSDSKPELGRVAAILKNNPGMKIEISGHTDNKGSATYNQRLSEARARSVIDYLLSMGIEKSRLTYSGLGFTKPVASNDTEEGRQLNRRIEFKIIAVN